MDAEQEIAVLARVYGEPARAAFEFTVQSDGFTVWLRRLTQRRGEIVVVVPRGHGRVLLHRKPHYPENVYRLPTGGVEKGEAVADAAQREFYEELGFQPQSLRLLGVLDNVFVLPNERLVYPSFVLRTEEYTQPPTPMDLDEQISGFSDADVMELRAAAHYLASLPGPWREWGQFRAAAHQWLVKELTKV
jgi:ADP-ribose pyrophosphatase YjhB (NUDIX family)